MQQLFQINYFFHSIPCLCLWGWADWFVPLDSLSFASCFFFSCTASVLSSELLLDDAREDGLLFVCTVWVPCWAVLLSLVSSLLTSWVLELGATGNTVSGDGVWLRAIGMGCTGGGVGIRGGIIGPGCIIPGCGCIEPGICVCWPPGPYAPYGPPNGP